MVPRRRRHFDNTQATKEGWQLLLVEGRYCIQRVDKNPVFENDDFAGLFVVKQADAGSPYHQRAVELALTTAPPESRRPYRSKPTN